MKNGMPKGFWSYERDHEPPTTPPPDYAMTKEEFMQLSPGMRSEIWRDFIKKENDQNERFGE